MADPNKKKKSWLKVAAMVGLLFMPALIFYVFVFLADHKANRLPFYGPRKITEREFHGRTIKDTVYHEIPPFRLLMPDSSVLDGRKLDGHIYVAHFLDFSVLDSIPKEVIFVAADVLAEHPDVYFLTQIENYSGQHLSAPSSFTTKLAGRDTSWLYTIGTGEEFARLKSEGYFIHDPDLKVQKDPYSLVLIDKEKRIRGYYNPILAADAKSLKDEIAYLKKEYMLDYKTHRYFEYNEKVEQKKK